jgi:predicted small secreted protein
MKKITFALLALTVLLTGCNTINGVGKDFEKLGEKVQDASKK